MLFFCRPKLLQKSCKKAGFRRCYETRITGLGWLGLARVGVAVGVGLGYAARHFAGVSEAHLLSHDGRVGRAEMHAVPR
jgi:hypothetical protein